MSGLVSGLQNRVRRFESARNLPFENIGSLDEWLSQRSAKPCTAVRIRQEPQDAGSCRFFCFFFSGCSPVVFPLCGFYSLPVVISSVGYCVSYFLSKPIKIVGLEIFLCKFA